MKNILSAADIGIIGGADGPTAIFVDVSPDWWVYALGALAVVGAAVFLLIRKRRK